ncbi:MAG: hypothetical protein GKR89_32975 [Candidatus Latescibacteria bacterium]|nr:hypothetical protein [Candidatus Latescibacterota bacterium]
MKGFHETGELAQLLDRLQKSCQAEGLASETVFFWSAKTNHLAWDVIPSYQPPVEWGQITNLEKAFSDGSSRAPIVLLVTDNVQAVDAQDPATQDIKGLYAQFAQDSVNDLYAIPFILPFEGRLENPLGSGATPFNQLKQLNSDARLVPDRPEGWVHYTGLRGLILYAVLTDKKIRRDYAKLIKKFHTADKSMQPLRMKPIEESIQLTPFNKKRGRDLPLDEPHKVQFSFDLDSKLDHLNINPGDSPSELVKFEVERPHIQASRDDRIFFGGAKPKRGRVSPPHLAEVLTKDTKKSYNYMCTAQLGPFPSDHIGFWDRLGLLRKDPITAQYDFSVALKIPPHSFQMTPAYKDEYFTGQQGHLDRIYTPVDLVAFLNPEGLTVVPEGGRIVRSISYSPPLYPWITLALVVSVPIALVVLGFMYWFWAIKYRFANEITKSRLNPLKGRQVLPYETAGGEPFQLGEIHRVFPRGYKLVCGEDVELWNPASGEQVGVEDSQPADVEPTDGTDIKEPGDASDDRPAVLLEKNKIWVLRHMDNDFEVERL